MISSKIKDHIEIAKSRLPEQDKESNNIVKFQSAFVRQLQEIEDLLWDIYSQRNVMTAKKKSLDFFGDMVDEPRNYREDEVFRLAILKKIIQNNCRGTPEEIIEIIIFFVLKSEFLPIGYKNANIYKRMNLIEWNYNSFLLELISNLTFSQVEVLKNLVYVSKPIGVSFEGIVISPLEQGIVFNEIDNVVLEYSINQNNEMLDTRYNDTENLLKIQRSQELNKSFFGISDGDDLTNGYLSELIE